MMNSLFAIAELESKGFMNFALLFGVMVLGGSLAARLFQKFRIPQVVGCIIAGILLGDVSGVIKPPTLELLKPFMMMALGFIGFMIGGELRGSVFKKYGKQFFIILFSEGIGAFLLVGFGCSAVAWLVTGDLPVSLGIGLVLGAISSATAPAATVNVLWEYKTRGPLTATILAIVALDDALALILYRGASTASKAIMGAVHKSVLWSTFLLTGEVIVAVGLGFLAGVFLYYLLKFTRADERILEFTIACLLMVTGIAMIPGIEPILPSMVLGVTVANMMPRRSKNVFALVEKFTPPIYIMFFVLAGAHMEFSRLALWVGVMIFVYLLCRAVGKTLGSWFGVRFSGAPQVVGRYLGICLQSQAGVAIGLAILAGHQFGSDIGQTIIMVVMTATFFTEILGPMLVKLGVKRAGEVGLNVTEDDLIKLYSVKDVMDSKPDTISMDLPLGDILEIFSKSDSLYYPVIDDKSQLTGAITISGIKEMFANREVAGWLLACDVAGPVSDKTTPEKPLEEVIEYMRDYDLEHIPVVTSEKDEKLAGLLDYHKVLRKVSAEVLHRRRMADETSLQAGAE